MLPVIPALRLSVPPVTKPECVAVIGREHQTVLAALFVSVAPPELMALVTLVGFLLNTSEPLWLAVFTYSNRTSPGQLVGALPLSLFNQKSSICSRFCPLHTIHRPLT